MSNCLVSYAVTPLVKSRTFVLGTVKVTVSMCFWVNFNARATSTFLQVYTVNDWPAHVFNGLKRVSG